MLHVVCACCRNQRPFFEGQSEKLPPDCTFVFCGNIPGIEDNSRVTKQDDKRVCIEWKKVLAARCQAYKGDTRRADTNHTFAVGYPGKEALTIIVESKWKAEQLKLYKDARTSSSGCTGFDLSPAACAAVAGAFEASPAYKDNGARGLGKKLAALSNEVGKRCGRARSRVTVDVGSNEDLQVLADGQAAGVSIDLHALLMDAMLPAIKALPPHADAKQKQRHAVLSFVREVKWALGQYDDYTLDMSKRIHIHKYLRLAFKYVCAYAELGTLTK